MLLHQQEALAKILEHEDEDYYTRDDYSGRGMFGRQTYAVVSDLTRSILLEVVQDVADEYTDEGSFADMFGIGRWQMLDFVTNHMKWDHMGLRYVYY
jgi:hypothetical protein